MGRAGELQFEGKEKEKKRVHGRGAMYEQAGLRAKDEERGRLGSWLI